MSGSRVNLNPKFGELNRRPEALTEVNKLGRSLKKRATDVLACFDRPGASNGPTEALNGRPEHLRGFRDLTHGSSRQRRRIARRCLMKDKIPYPIPSARNIPPKAKRNLATHTNGVALHVSKEGASRYIMKRIESGKNAAIAPMEIPPKR